MKKRTFKRVASAIAALAMVATMAAPIAANLTVSADDLVASPNAPVSDGDHTIALQNQAGTGHTYKIYKIFDGKVPEGEQFDGYSGEVTPGSGFGRTASQILIDIDWAEGIDGETFIEKLLQFDRSIPNATGGGTTTFEAIFAGCDTAASVAKKIEAYSSYSGFTRAFADFLSAQTEAGGVLSGKELKSGAQNDYTEEEIASSDAGTGGVKFKFNTSKDDPDCIHDGYYAIIEQPLSETDESATKTVHLVGVYDASAGAEIVLKSSMPNFTKKVKDKNDSSYTEALNNPPTGTDLSNWQVTAPYTTAWQDTADHDIGDVIPFQLKATVPSSLADYRFYNMTFHDNVNPKDASGATAGDDDEFDSVFNVDLNNVTVYLQHLDGNGSPKSIAGHSDGKVPLTKDTHYTIKDYRTNKGSKPDSPHDNAGTTQETGWDCDFEIVMTDLLKLSSGLDASNDITSAILDTINGGTVEIVVEYNATLTADAKLGAEGNWNDAYISYSNNPNLTESGDETEDDTSYSDIDRVGVFTYEVKIDKVDHANGELLPGAEFTLQKWYEAGAYDTGAGVMNAVAGWYNVTIPGIVADGKVTPSSSTKTTFEFKGLDAGYYKLAESTVPSGYNGMKDVLFEIAASHTQDNAEDGLELTSLDCFLINQDPDTKAFTRETQEPKTWGEIVWLDAEGEEVMDEEEEHYIKGTTGESLSGVIYAKIENTSVALLPGTGGIGTTLFYVIGGILVVGSGIVLITKKRVEKDS